MHSFKVREHVFEEITRITAHKILNFSQAYGFNDWRAKMYPKQNSQWNSSRSMSLVRRERGYVDIVYGLYTGLSLGQRSGGGEWVYGAAGGGGGVYLLCD